MHHYSVKPIHLALRTSQRLALLLGIVCVSVMLLIALLPLPPWAAILGALALLCSTGYECSRHAWLRTPQAITALEVDARGELRCFSRAHDWCAAEVLGSSFVTPKLTVLNLRLKGRRLVQHVVLLPDAVEREQFRRLRVWLRWGQMHDQL
ncbi:hypothetical protein GALL_368600 [mine drainage metagenome]|uniref:Toxin CptA n=1 Tax=mine drainage metagenome TaxID=410659 RepID=A0A1J5QD76_9ZZZZ